MTDDKVDIRVIYLNNLSETCNFYAREADDEGLEAVYKAGVEAGQKEKNDGQ